MESIPYPAPDRHPAGRVTVRLHLRNLVLSLADAAATRGLRVYLPVAAAIAVLGVAGVAARLNGSYLFDLDSERNVPAVFSALLLAVSAALVLVYRAMAQPGRRYPAGLLMAAILAWMSLDEFAAFHEFLERRTGVDWQTLYLPVIVVAGVVWVMMLRDLRFAPRAAAYWLVAAGAWFVSQTLEFFEFDAADKPVRGYDVMMVAEELLEMVGSSFFGLAMLCAVGIAVRRSTERGGHLLPPL